MAKSKKNVKIKEETSITLDTNVNVNNVLEGELKSTEDMILSNVEFIPNIMIPDISTISLNDLVKLENACSLICKKYEIGARIEKEDYDKFNEFKGYHQKLFKELERRIILICKD